MSGLFKTLLRTVILDDSAYLEWRERPNLFLRGIVLIALITLVAELIVFGTNLVARVTPVSAAAIEAAIKESVEQQSRWNPGWQSMPEEGREMMERTMDVVVPMVVDLSHIEAPLPRGVTGFFQAMGAYVSRVLAAVGGWMFYGVLVLVAVNLLGGSAKLPQFLGMTALYIVPGLLAILQPVYCVGFFLALVGTIWSVVVYVKAVSVASDLDVGTSILAVLAPLIAIVLLAILVAIMGFLLLVIVLP